jgi:tetratricopeptide (TPR) repeat protein
MRPFRRLPVALIALVLLCATQLLASSSEPKKPADKADELAAKATDAYNKGVRKMEHADQFGLQQSPTYGYDYAAKPDGKAIREYEEAIGEFAKAVSYNPKMKEAYNNLGYCYRRVGKLSHSLDAYDKAIALDPDFAQAREYRGETYLALGQPEKAEADLAKLQELKSKHAEQLTLAIGMYRDREKQAAAGQ